MQIKKPVDPWIHLKVYGYAPGDYYSQCHICNKIKPDLDKRAYTCYECAKELYAKS